MKHIKTFEHNNNRFEYGDYIIYQKINWKNEKYPLTIMSINGTPGPIGTKYDYYTINELYELIDGELMWISSFDPKQIEQNRLEENTVYHTKTLEDAKNMIFVINNSRKYNI